MSSTIGEHLVNNLPDVYHMSRIGTTISGIIAAVEGQGAGGRVSNL
jgi:hypothetical protein